MTIPHPSHNFSANLKHLALASAVGAAFFGAGPTAKALPPVTNGLVVSLAADAINTGDSSQVRTADGNVFVKLWNDQSGNGQHAANADTGTQPQYLAGDLNGLPTVKWDGTGKFLEGPSNTTIKTIFAVCKKDADASSLDGMFCQSRNADSQNIRGDANNWNQTGYRADGNDFPDNGQVDVNGTSGHVHNGQWHVLMEVSASSPSFTYQLGQQAYTRYFNGRIAEFIIYNRELTSDEKTAVGSYLAVKYGLDTAYVIVPQAKITSFGPGATIGALSGHVAAIRWLVPHGTEVTTLAPTFTLSTGATCTVGGVAAVAGETRNFTNPVAYVVTSSDLAITNTYTVTVHVLPPVPPGPPVAGYTRWFDASALGLADNDPVTQWIDNSGNGADATVPSGNANPVFVADAGTGTSLGAIYFAGNGGAASSGALLFARDSGIRTVFSVFKGNSFLLTDQSAYHFHRSEGGATDSDPATGLWGHDASGYVTSGQTWVNGVLQDYPALINSTSSMPTNLHNGFNLVEVLTTGTVQADSFNKDRGNTHAGNQYQAEVILYDRVLTEQERAQVEQYLMSKWFAVSVTPDARILDFGPGAAVGPVVGNAADIAWTVPYGTDVTMLAPAFTLSSGATCTVGGSTVNPGDPLDFTDPVEFTVTSSDSLITNVYTVTVTLFGSGQPKGKMNVRTYDSTQGTSFLNPIANLLTVVPSGTGLQTTDINYGTFAGVLPGITSDDTFSVIWDGWLDVTKAGHGNYTFGTASDDGSVVYVDLNNDGVFDPATEVVVNNNNIQPTTVKTGTVTLNMNSVHVLIGYFENEGGQSMEARFAKGTGVAWGSMQNVIGAGPYFQASDPNPTTPSYADWARDYAGGATAPADGDYNHDGVQNGTAYFMGENGRATNPGVVNGKVTWPHVGAVTSFAVQVSDNLHDWSAATAGVDSSDPTKVVFTLPTGAAQKFCRLMVVP
ncbi:MAG: PA14 domain-containing protein [Verrucomicrobia bacterium]|nr:PA14 domain-containing protein [Verrucomicrobiota bacterium]